MKRYGRIILIAILSCCLPRVLLAQTGMSRFGLGINVSKDVITQFLIPITLSAKWRIEPELGIYHYSGSDHNRDVSSTLFNVGTGFYAILRRQKTAIYLGGRLGIMGNLQTNENKQSPGTNGNTCTEQNITKLYVAPALGGEYFFIRHFSLGGEIQFQYVFNAPWKERNTVDESILQTKTYFILRWYF
jgi:hypothetical protein